MPGKELAARPAIVLATGHFWDAAMRDLEGADAVVEATAANGRRA